MAITIISDNLVSENVVDKGRFETDPSAWFVTTGFYTPERDTTHKVAGNFGGKFTITDLYMEDDTPYSYNFWRGPFKCNAGTYPIADSVHTRKFILSVWIKNDPEHPAIKDSVRIAFRPHDHPEVPHFYDVVSDITMTGADIDEWTKITCQFTATGNLANSFQVLLKSASIFFMAPNLDTVHPRNYYFNPGGSFYLDQVEIYEYVDEENPCDTLQITGINTTGSTGSNGSAEVLATGFISTGEYSIDNLYWQTTKWFFTLAPGAYTAYVRDPISGCQKAQAFYINEDSNEAQFEFSLLITHQSAFGINDGAIAIQYTGQGGPFTASLDNVNYGLVTGFYNMAPGIYTVYAKDNIGRIVSKSAEVQPAQLTFSKVFLSKNPMLLTRNQTSNATREAYRIVLQVHAQTSPGADHFENVLHIPHEPNNDGTTTFNAQEAFRGILKPQPPAINESSVLILDDRSTLAYNTYADTYAGLEAPVNPEQGSPYLVVYGGLEKKDWPIHTDFEQFIDQGSERSRWLSWAPLTRYMDKGQENYCNFYCTDRYYESIVQANIYYDDGSIAEAFVLHPALLTPRGTILQVPIGPANSGVYQAHPEKNIAHYEIYVIDSSYSYASQFITVHLTEVKPVNTRYFLFLNSLGTFEVIRTTGIGTQTATVTKDLIQKYLPHNYRSHSGEKAVYRASNSRSSSHSTGFYEDAETMNWLQDFALSTQVYVLKGNTRVPVILTKSSIPLHKDDEYKYFMRFDLQEIYSNDVFTPDL